MAKTEFRFDGLDKMEKRLSKAIEQQYPREFERMVLQIAYELQRLTKEKTPVDTNYLQDNWKIGEVKKVGSDYFIEVFNNSEYAEAVEDGHRLRDGTFQEGVHMLELSIEEIYDKLPFALQSWIDNFIDNHVM